jgi:hypothetical protein
MCDRKNRFHRRATFRPLHRGACAYNLCVRACSTPNCSALQTTHGVTPQKTLTPRQRNRFRVQNKHGSRGATFLPVTILRRDSETCSESRRRRAQHAELAPATNHPRRNAAVEANSNRATRESWCRRRATFVLSARVRCVARPVGGAPHADLLGTANHPRRSAADYASSAGNPHWYRSRRATATFSHGERAGRRKPFGVFTRSELTGSSNHPRRGAAVSANFGARRDCFYSTCWRGVRKRSAARITFVRPHEPSNEAA